jgi:molybdenum cofactor cytidylyltransferase
MRASVECALDEVRRHMPAPEDGWLLVPADHPLLDAAILDVLLERWKTGRDRILVPTFEGRRGHPTLFRWSLADEVARIPPDHGLNWLIERHRDEVAELPVDDDSVLLDLDTPEDLAAAQRRARSLDGR